MKVKITRRKGANPYAGLFSEPPSIESEAEYRKLMIVEELLQLMEDQDISRSELAKRMGVQPSRVTSMMSGSNNFTIETLVRAGRAVGADIELHFVPMKKPGAKTKKKAARKSSKLTRAAEGKTKYRTRNTKKKP